ncbi:hypothetical protein [Lactococcus cremoris]|uniref:hypothetical protein n=1 Tax=Lactococcus lactis subsp. cremoris TaxID=1359 RepID=UPI00196320F9|nr:hypothetical protein [Lactococcus cremoris]WKD56446.1 hypothetical protein LLW34_03130 [Lactococcus cremoris]
MIHKKTLTGILTGKKSDFTPKQLLFKGKIFIIIIFIKKKTPLTYIGEGVLTMAFDLEVGA